MNDGGWLQWGYLLSSILQLVIVVIVVCFLAVIVNGTIRTMKDRWKK